MPSPKRPDPHKPIGFCNRRRVHTDALHECCGWHGHACAPGFVLPPCASLGLGQRSWRRGPARRPRADSSLDVVAWRTMVGTLHVPVDHLALRRRTPSWVARQHSGARECAQESSTAPSSAHQRQRACAVRALILDCRRLPLGVAEQRPRHTLHLHSQDALGRQRTAECGRDPTAVTRRLPPLRGPRSVRRSRMSCSSDSHSPAHTGRLRAGRPQLQPKVSVRQWQRRRTGLRCGSLSPQLLYAAQVLRHTLLHVVASLTPAPEPLWDSRPGAGVRAPASCASARARRPPQLADAPSAVSARPRLGARAPPCSVRPPPARQRTCRSCS